MRSASDAYMSANAPALIAICALGESGRTSERARVALKCKLVCEDRA